MKTKELTLFILILLLVGTVRCDFCPVDGKIYGNGKVISEKRDVPAFNGIRVSSGIDVYIKQGKNEALKVEADENLHDVIRTEVRNGILNIYTEVNIRKANTKKVYLVYRELHLIKVTSAGDVTGINTLKTNELEISLSSAGDLELDVDAEVIDLSISSSGDARLSGRTDYLRASLSSAGDLNAYDLKARRCRIGVSSAGNAKIHVTEELDATASSAGDIYYMGNPSSTSIRSSSAGGIHKR